jgi:hypothetical protein
MQSRGVPVTRDLVLLRGNEIYQQMYGTTRSSGFLRKGWIDRFMQRHPNLCLRGSQVIKRVRAEATDKELRNFFNEFIKHVIEQNATSDRIFNMDETGLVQRTKTRKGIAVKGSRNVWSKATEVSFHLTIVAAGSADGFHIHPQFIVPGQSLQRTTMGSCVNEDAVATTSEKGFINAKIFKKWLIHFERSVPGTVKRPLILVYDDYSSHYSEEIIQLSIEIGVILVLLPANATHLIQPCDVAVFKPYKKALKRDIEAYRSYTSASSVTRLMLSSKAYICADY